MECNSEEAFTARGIATKLENKCFSGARRTYPELENMNQLLTVSKVNSLASPSAKICGDSISSEHHAPMRVEIQEEGSATHEVDQRNCMKEATHTADQKSLVPVVDYNCPDFFDFDKFRDFNQIAVDQIWAFYDTLDGMPRLYAKVNHIDTSNLKVEFTWLEHNARNEQEVNWTSKRLPVACGNFCIGGIRVLETPSTYLSHSISWTKGKDDKSYEIHPKKDEVWALYKGWSKQWSFDANNHRPYGYDVVQILSDDLTDASYIVSPLVKIKGFVSLFAQAKDRTFFSIPSSELLRFSHSVPFYRTNGHEKRGVTEGFLELDTAALPSDLDLDAAFPSITLHSHMAFDFTTTFPDSEFHNFEGHSCEKFQRGQIWALYCDHDAFPKFYGWVRKVELEPFKVHLIWLEACPQKAQEKRWLMQDIPVSCGKFRIRKWNAAYNTFNTFSHLVSAATSTYSRIEILPQKGEIWAIYMNWAPRWTPSSIDACKFAIGEIIARTEAGTKVYLLSRVNGYRAVFKRDRGKGVLKIPTRNRLKFSHQIPSFRLTEEKGGQLRGFYELDPASLPNV